MPENDPLNLSLIQMVQRARLAHDAEAKPSEIGAVYWIEVKRETPGPGPTARAGVFVLRVSAETVDASWEVLKAATRAGELGYKSKVATASRDDRAENRTRVVHVLVADADDSADVARVRAALLALGFTPAEFRQQREAEPPPP